MLSRSMLIRTCWYRELTCRRHHLQPREQENDEVVEIAGDSQLTVDTQGIWDTNPGEDEGLVNGHDKLDVVAEGITQRIVHSDFFFQAEDGIRDLTVTGVQTCALPI